jgi:hypothetical protein
MATGHLPRADVGISRPQFDAFVLSMSLQITGLAARLGREEAAVADLEALRQQADKFAIEAASRGATAAASRLEERLQRGRAVIAALRRSVARLESMTAPTPAGVTPSLESASGDEGAEEREPAELDIIFAPVLDFGEIEPIRAALDGSHALDELRLARFGEGVCVFRALSVAGGERLANALREDWYVVPAGDWSRILALSRRRFNLV